MRRGVNLASVLCLKLYNTESLLYFSVLKYIHLSVDINKLHSIYKNNDATHSTHLFISFRNGYDVRSACRFDIHNL